MLGIEEFEGEVAQLLERVPGNLASETDADPESNDEQQPDTFATQGNPTGTSKWQTVNHPPHRR